MEILTVPDVADLLKVVEKTIYTMAQRSEIPAFKVRGQWRFRRVDINEWIDQQLKCRPKAELAARRRMAP
jgi:excisionase family DNA binding protein